MASCELCGRSMKGRGRNITVEGASLLVCPQCASKFGGQRESPPTRRTTSPPTRPSWTGGAEKQTSSRPDPSHSARIRRKPKPRPRSPATLDEMMLVEDYAERIRSARQKMKMSQEELAQKVGERISTLQAIESSRIKPTRKTIRNLERELDISLLEPIGAAPIRTDRTRGSDDSATLGDVVRIKRKKSQKSD